MNRIGDWMITASGGQYWPLDPRPAEVSIIDIGAALSKLCRFGGHTMRFYSVAEHSVLVSRVVPPWLQRQALLHDASEARTGDLPLPARDPRLAPGLRQVESDLARALLGPDLHATWAVAERGETLESRVVSAADRIQMMARVQQLEARGRLGLDDFWDEIGNFRHCGLAPARRVFEELWLRSGRTPPSAAGGPTKTAE